MSGISLNLVVLRSKDIEVAAEFYRCLGLEFVRHRHGSGPEHFAAEMMGGVFEIYPLASDDDPPTSGTRIGFGMSSLDDLLAKLQSYPEALVSSPGAFSMGIPSCRKRSGRASDRAGAAVMGFWWWPDFTWRNPAFLTRNPAQ